MSRTKQIKTRLVGALHHGLALLAAFREHSTKDAIIQHVAGVTNDRALPANISDQPLEIKTNGKFNGDIPRVVPEDLMMLGVKITRLALNFKVDHRAPRTVCIKESNFPS